MSQEFGEVRRLCGAEILNPVKWYTPTYISTPSHLYKYPGVLQLLKIPVDLSGRVLQLLKIPVDLSVHPLIVVGAPGRLAPHPVFLVRYRGIFVPRAIFFDDAPTFFANLLLFNRIFRGIGPGVDALGKPGF